VVRTVVVLGSGAAGLTAALAAKRAGAEVDLYEKAETIGGTTALSGGACWIPINPHAQNAGLSDSRDEALAYLNSLSFGLIDPAMAETLVDRGPDVVNWLESTTTLKFSVVGGYPDYHPERVGGLPLGGRTLDPGLCSYRELGKWAKRVTPSGRVESLTLAETGMGGGTGHLDAETTARRKAEDLRGCGLSLIGHLLKACLECGIVPKTGTRGLDLEIDSGGVSGIQLQESNGTVISRQADAVVLATGGFEWNDELVRAFLRGPMSAPVSLETCTGDGLLMAMRAGASLANMREAWWTPCVRIPDPTGRINRPYLINRERTLPGSIMVNRSGKRFTNEAANYNSIGGAFHVLDAVDFGYPNLPAWLIFDQAYLRRYGFAHLTPTDTSPAWLTHADSIENLAAMIGVEPAGIARTVSQWNTYVDQGKDADFCRGQSVYDTWAGDAAHRGTPQGTLGKISAPPYYAVEVLSGALGTRGGPRTETHGRVLDTRGQPIKGLYAVGNAMASPTGMVYGGAGGTLGPALVFGYLAGIDAASGNHCDRIAAPAVD